MKLFLRNRKIKVWNDINVGWINRNISRNRVINGPGQSSVLSKTHLQKNSSRCRNLRIAFIRTRRWSNWRWRFRPTSFFYTAENAHFTTIAVTKTSSEVSKTFSSIDFTECKCSSVQANCEEKATSETKNYTRHIIFPSCTLCSLLLVPLISPCKHKIKKITNCSRVTLPGMFAVNYRVKMCSRTDWDLINVTQLTIIFCRIRKI